MFIREGKLDLGTIPQPLYAYAAGMTLLHEGEEAFNSGVRNTFVELCWGGGGVGEVVYYGQAFEIRENDVFIWLPGEDHLRRSVSGAWRCRWLCFDGPLAEASAFLSFPALSAFRSVSGRAVPGDCGEYQQH